MRFASLVLLAACGSSAPSLAREAACPDCGPGEVRFALHGPRVHASRAALDARGDGSFAYITDHAVFLLDESLAEQADAMLDHLALAVASNGDTTYVLENDTSKVTAEFLADRVLSAFDPSGQRMWTADLAFGSLPATLVADTLGSYTASEKDVAAYDPDGALRAGFTSAQIMCALPHGGLITSLSIGTRSTITNLFPTGPARWSRTWSAIKGSSMRLLDAATTDTGRIAIVARVVGQMLDLGGTELATPSNGTFEVVALLDPDGAVHWVTLLPAIDADLKVVVSGEQIVLGGSFRGDGAALGLPTADDRDAFLAVIDQNGVVRADLLGGPGDQELGVLRAGTDGTVVLTVVNTGKLAIGSRTFGSSADYVIAMLP